MAYGRGNRQPVRQEFVPTNPHKHVSSGLPKRFGEAGITLRSNWERAFAQFCDTNGDVISWSSEPVSIPYPDPLTGKFLPYIPDFLVSYVDKSGKTRNVLIEIKPAHEALAEHAGTMQDKTLLARNAAKWAAAAYWCQRRGIEFRVMTEMELFTGAEPKRIKTTTLPKYSEKTDLVRPKRRKRAVVKAAATRKRTVGAWKSPKRPKRPRGVRKVR